jgi:hypothetical protein
MSTLAILVAAVLGLLALLHLYWALGGFWPGTDARTLARTVVGGPLETPMPSAIACAAVAALLALAVLIVLAHAGVIAPPISVAPLRVAMLGIAGVLTARGAFGFLETRLRPVIVGSPYAQLNIALYSPLALALGLATFTVAL